MMNTLVFDQASDGGSILPSNRQVSFIFIRSSHNSAVKTKIMIVDESTGVYDNYDHFRPFIHERCSVLALSAN
jgi:hypothetical protein